MNSQLVVDPSMNAVERDGCRIILPPKEVRILATLAQARGRAVSRESLLDSIWGKDRALGIGSRTIDQHIARLRRKMRQYGGQIITVIGVGYRVEGISCATPEPERMGTVREIERTFGKNPYAEITIRIPGAAAWAVKGNRVSLV